MCLGLVNSWSYFEGNRGCTALPGFPETLEGLHPRLSTFTITSDKCWLPGVEDCSICAATDAAGWQVELRVKVCPQNNERRGCRRLCVALPSCAMMAPWACAVNAQCVLQTVGTEAVTVTTHDVEGGEVGVGVGMCVWRGGVGVRDPIGMGC